MTNNLANVNKATQQAFTGSCNVKIFMKLEDPTETYELFLECRNPFYRARYKFNKHIKKIYKIRSLAKNLANQIKKMKFD